MYQNAYSGNGDASVALTNSGTLNVKGTANATGGTDAYASASINAGIDQYAYAPNGTASADVTNTGTINLLATAKATSGTAGTNDSATAYAYIGTGIHQYANGSTATVTNSGTLNFVSSATAVGDEYAYASGSASGIDQNAYGADASATIANAATGVINVAATGNASGNQATAYAYAYGASQYASASSTAAVSFSNAGTFNIDANANAAAVTDGYAFANASGLYQQAYGTAASYTFTNSGSFTVDAVATAKGTSSGTAYATAYGYYAYGDGVNATVSNSGTFAVKAKATGDTYASAVAYGMNINANGPSELLTGTITNSGSLSVTAEAAGGTSDNATASGIYLQSGVNTATLTNTGSIKVSAQTTGGSASATGIVVNDLGVVVPTVTDIFTLNNTGGSIIARNSVDGGATWTHGLAIDSSNAPNAVVINLKANGATLGSIYGDIDLSADDVINVSSGETVFDGKINPGTELEGTLNILSGGTLYLVDKPAANTSYDGAAKVYVDALTIAPGGKLALQLPSYPSGTATYPSIVANTANITGATLEVRPSSATGLYANSYTFDNVIDATTLTGTFASLVVAGSPTPLLAISATYDTGNNVDLTLTRIAFNSVAGMTVNQTSAAAGIESTYSSTLTGPYATLLATLFTQSATTYANSLDQLSGSQYASYLQSLNGLGGRFNGLLTQVGQCAVTTELRKACRKEASARIWGQVDYGRISKDGDVEAPGYKADQYFLALGTDFDVAQNLVLGLGGAYVKDDLNFDRYNGKIKSDGFQIGAYAVYAPGPYYVKAAVSYTDLKGNSSRAVSIGTTAGTITGKPDAQIWTVNGEAGYNFDLNGSSITPYAGLTYSSAKLKGFTEAGVAGANLDVFESSNNRTASTAGLRWTGHMGGIVPELDLGWNHQFGDQRASLVAQYNLSPGSDFTVISQTEKRDMAVVGLSITGPVGSLGSFRLGYQGRFNGDFESHSGGVTLIVPFGGK